MENSINLFNKAKKLIPGGVNSPVRACKSVEADPLFIEKGKGCRLFDADGAQYIDYVGSWGPMILGYNHPQVIEEITKVLQRGTSFGAPCDLEVMLAEIITNGVASVAKIRMVNSGTEATMSAIRLARGYTKRDLIIKFDGCYHGHADSLLVEAGSGVATLSIPGSPGVPQAFASHTISLPYNDIEAFRDTMIKKGDKIAAVIVEPVAGNMGLVKPVPDFLETLREYSLKTGSVLIFDEVMTGFRLAFGGAQSLYGITPDLTCFGKIIGGGLPVGAYGGKEEIMNLIAPSGPVYQAGTLSGNPLAMAAGIKTLSLLQEPDFYQKLEEKSAHFENGIKTAAQKADFPIFVSRVGSMLGMFFTKKEVQNFADAKTADLKAFAQFYKKMRDKGIYIAPSQFEVLFLSSAHQKEDIDTTIKAVQECLTRIKI
ncbi:MAG: glutamate-1-semialdehyde 2,1-aminomutase [Deltaproteobacteria bacterium]|nr:glutamate-1-semialdehyde 2,1-aminomutase [Deltaproteobacteria bacterium]